MCVLLDIELIKLGNRRFLSMTMRELSTDALVCRVQFVKDIEPFVDYNVREPSRPLYHTFNTRIPLSYQIGAVLHLLNAPHRVSV